MDLHFYNTKSHNITCHDNLAIIGLAIKYLFIG
jgi:hypothetical protein